MHLWIPVNVRCDDEQHMSKAHHPLFALSIFDEWFKEACIETCDENVVIALRIRSDEHRSLGKCLFITVQLQENQTQKKIETESPLALTVSSAFVQHYRINLREQHEFKIIQPTALDKVVLGAKSRETYMWLNERNWMTEFLVKVCQQKVLCRRGDVLLAPLPFTKDVNLNESVNFAFDVLTLDCYPVAQGIITVKTEIVVNDLSTDMVSDVASEFRYTLSGSQKMNSYESYLALLQYMYSSTFLRHVPHKKLFNSIIGIYIASVSKLMLPSIKNILRIRILTNFPFVNYRLAKEDFIDPLNVVFVSEWISKRLELEDKCWIILNLPPNYDSSDATQKSRFAQVCVLNSENLRNLDHHLFLNLDDSVYLSPHIIFNMTSNHLPFDYHQQEAKIRIEQIKFLCQHKCCYKKKKKSLPFARETHLSLVCSPINEASLQLCTKLLNRYFETPRYLQTGDIVCVGVSDDDDFTFEESLKLQRQVVFFQVTAVKSFCKDNKYGSLVQKGESSLFLNEECQSYIPVSMDTFLGLKNLHPIWNNPIPLGMTKYVKKLESLILPFVNFKNIRKCLWSSVLVIGPSGCGKSTVIQAVCRHLNMHYLEADCLDTVGDKSQTTITRLTQVLKKACKCVPCVLVLKNIHLLCRHRDGTDEDPRVASAFREIISENLKLQSEYPLTIIGTTNDKSNVTDDFHEIFLHQMPIESPDEEERKDILFGLLSSVNCASDISITYWAQQTGGFLLGDFAALIQNASYRAYNNRLISQPLMSFHESEDLFLSGVFIEQKDLTDVLNEMQAAHSDVIGAPKVPNVSWQDIGGLEDVKEAILETIQLPLQHPELFSSEIRRSGVLLFGPPGTGKTLLAKAVATECNLHFLSVKGPELLNMYVGQSEQNVRAVFQRARSAAPCVIFFDELDSLAPNRGRSGDSGGVMDRVVSQLLAELDGLDKIGNVFVIGATNRPDLIDPALLRPGRFDKLLFVGIGEDWTSKLKVLQALTMKFSLDSELKLAEVAKRCPPNLTGADIYALCTDAMMNALSRRIDSIQDGTGNQEDPVTLTLDDFTKALDSLVPSISLQELQHYQQLKNSLIS